MSTLWERFDSKMGDFLESKSGKGVTLAICVAGTLCAVAMGGGWLALMCLTGSILPAIEYFTYKPKEESGIAEQSESPPLAHTHKHQSPDISDSPTIISPDKTPQMPSKPKQTGKGHGG